MNKNIDFVEYLFQTSKVRYVHYAKYWMEFYMFPQRKNSPLKFLTIQPFCALISVSNFYIFSLSVIVWTIFFQMLVIQKHS